VSVADSLLSEKAPEQAAQIAYRGFGDGVNLRTASFAEETEITGPMAAKLWISSTTEDADLFVIVRLFEPAIGASKAPSCSSTAPTCSTPTSGWSSEPPPSA
jgi:hypothetical protein